jgi:hypothetical protein
LELRIGFERILLHQTYQIERLCGLSASMCPHGYISQLGCTQQKFGGLHSELRLQAPRAPSYLAGFVCAKLLLLDIPARGGWFRSSRRRRCAGLGGHMADRHEGAQKDEHAPEQQLVDVES